MADVFVANTSDLIDALKSATGGETIVLAPGVYTGLNFKKAPTFDVGVTITSADSAHSAVLTDFTLTGAKGLTFANVTLATLDHSDIAAKGAGFWAFNVVNSSEIHFDHVSFHGSLDGDVSNDVLGLSIRNSDSISIADCEFQQLGRALAVGQTDDVLISGNHAHHLRSDGFDFAEVGNVRITNNVLHDFSPTGTDHPDAIQFWTTGTKTASHDILISGNVIDRGGGAYTQGIFLRDQVGTLHYERVAISDNLIVGTGYSAIRVQGATDLTLTDNELVSFVGDHRTYMLIQDSDRIVATGNSAISISFDNSSHVSQSGNLTTAAVSDVGLAAFGRWLEDHSANTIVLEKLYPALHRPELVLPGDWMPVSGSQFGFFGSGSYDFA